MRLQRHHQELTNGVGKCSKPMWQWGMPCFCDEPAYGTYIPGDTWRVAESGELRRFDGRYCGYVPALACPAHGGPERPVTVETAHFGEVLAYLAVELLGWEWRECESTETDHVHGPNCPYSWTFKEPGSTNSYEIGLRYLLTGNGMLEIIEAMRERGYTIEINAQIDWTMTSISQRKVSGSYVHEEEVVSIPESVARCAYETLRTETNQGNGDG